jgi:hypothetical protein
MARFRGTVQGNKGGASRLGSPKSGLTVTCDGWNLGIEVHASVDENGKDVFTVYKTGGSNGSVKQLIGKTRDET